MLLSDMAARKDEDGLMDDIELLNIHRYPESVPASMVAQIRNSKVYQKRLEELLKGMPTGRRSSRMEVVLDQSKPSEEPPPAGIASFFKKLLP
ncbi:MAG: hypothetical protein JNM27_14780 [Leptospirales bacterium]|nr:hypothetical protein [Leptospirales bacterium]